MREPNDSKAFEVDGYGMEIWQPDLIVLPIPKNRFDTSSSMQIGVDITNNARTFFRFETAETLIPELMTLDGQVLPRLFTNNDPDATVQTNKLDSPSLGFKLTRLISNFTNLFKRSDYLLVEAFDITSININTRLFWHNNQLALEFHTTDFSFFNPSRCWFFDALYSGNYQLRFIYFRTRSNRTDSSTLEDRTTQEMKSGQLATPFVNLYLVQSVGTNHNAVEVDGIRFETVVPEEFLSIPNKNRAAKTAVQIGMSITNNPHSAP